MGQVAGGTDDKYAANDGRAQQHDGLGGDNEFEKVEEDLFFHGKCRSLHVMIFVFLKGTSIPPVRHNRIGINIIKDTD